MYRTSRSFAPCLAILLVLAAPRFGAYAADKSLSAASETAAEKLRRVLDQPCDLDITAPALDVAINQLREQTGINFVGDPATLVPTVVMGMANPAINIQSHGVPLRVALSKLLRAHHLTHVLVGDTVYITTPDKAMERQLQQSVSVNAAGETVRDVLKRLARETGANVVLDPHAAKEGQTELTVRLDEVPLETAVEVLADESGLRSVRLHNVLYVTSTARAKKLRKPAPAVTAPSGGWQVWPDGKGGFRLTTPGGAGVAGGAGIGGLGGMGGIAGGLGALGMGGGVAGMAGGVANPVPLTPPLPKAKQPAPDKPKAKSPPPAKPTVTPPNRDKPAPKDKSLSRANRPSTPADLLAWSRAAEPRAKTPSKPAEPSKPRADDRDSLPAKLSRRVDFPGYDDRRTTLDDALADLSKKYGVPFLLNEKGFKYENIMDVGKTEIATPVPIPAIKNSRVDVILRKILGRIPVPSGAAFLVRRDAVEITTGTFLQGEVWFNDPEGPHLPIVQVVVDKQPFDEVMKSLAEQANFNVLLDGREADKMKTPITAELYNVPADSAVLLLSGMVDLRPVRVDNVLFVTRAATAEAMEKARPQKPVNNAAYSWMISGPSGTLIRVPNE